MKTIYLTFYVILIFLKNERKKNNIKESDFLVLGFIMKLIMKEIKYKMHWFIHVILRFLFIYFDDVNYIHPKRP